MGRAAFYDQLFLSYEGFCEIICAVFSTKEIHKYKKIFNNFLSQNKDFQPPKSTENIVLSKWLHNIYLTKVENIKYKHCPKLWTCPFPEQEKMQEKLNLKYLKMLKTEN